MSCSELSSAVGETGAGTAPQATAWIAIEQPGPWGRTALTESRLDAKVGALLAERSAATSTKVVLTRHPDRPERTFDPESRRAWIAFPDSGLLRTGFLPDPAEALEWDLAALAMGDVPDFGESTDDLTVLACTNGSRDTCCAVRGRALVDALRTNDQTPAWLWESSHLGGHRFAPTALVLNTGYVHGRLEPDDLARVARVAREGRIDLDSARGRTSLEPRLQVADLAVRRATGTTEADALRVLAHDERRCEVRVTSGMAAGSVWLVDLEQREGPMRPESCGADPVPSRSWYVLGLHGPQR